MLQPLYVFDMDDTLINGDCSVLWNQYLVEKGIATDPNFLETDRKLMALYAIGQMDMEEYLDFVMRPLLHIPKHEVDNMVDDFVIRYVKQRLFSEAKHLIDSLTEQNQPMLIISATASFIVSKVARSIGITEAIGIDMIVKDGCYTSQIEGIPSYREGKIQRLKNWVEKGGDEYNPIHFYTDSINDLPLCEYSDFAYLINPCPQLKDASKNKDWEIYHWGK